MSIAFRNTRTHYGLCGRLLHWTSVALLLTVIVSADRFESIADSPDKAALIRTHASWGLVLLLVMGLRACWRCTNPNPVRSYTIEPWQIFAALFLHRLIYVIVISQCLLGVFNLCLAGNGIPFFHILETPVLMSRNDTLFALSNGLHTALYTAMLPLFAIHISAAIYHQIFGVIDIDR